MTTLGAAASAQPRPVAVHGVAYDSLRRRPLKEALVALLGGDRTAVTDSRGRFHFDSVPPGVHTFSVQHPDLDSLGLSGPTRRATITDGREEIRLSVPSFETLWRTACGDGRIPEDSGFVYGTVREAGHHTAVAGAIVDVAWTEVTFVQARSTPGRVTSGRQVVERKWHNRARTDSTGNYTVCDIPAAYPWGYGTFIRADAGTSVSGIVDLALGAGRVRRRDLVVGAADTSRRGIVSGVLMEPNGHGFPDLLVVLDGVREMVTDADGRFFARDVLTGTRLLEVRAVGMKPTVTTVDVFAGDTAVVVIEMRSIPTLATTRVTAMHGNRSLHGQFLVAEIESRRKTGLGYTMDSTAIIVHRTFIDAIRGTPNVQIRDAARAQLEITVADGHGGRCTPDIWIDGTLAVVPHLIDLQPYEVAAVEIFPRYLELPARFIRDTRRGQGCGAILVWTKYGVR
jgi:hypothetical protein